jgi:hypothetical protein
MQDLTLIGIGAGDILTLIHSSRGLFLCIEPFYQITRDDGQKMNPFSLDIKQI